MLRVTFHAALGEASLQARAIYFRFCADATLRGPDNSLAATRVDDCWLIGQRRFRQLDCAGPVYVRVRTTASATPICMGPYKLVTAAAGLMYADEVPLALHMPGWNGGRDTCHEVSLLSGGT